MNTNRLPKALQLLLENDTNISDLRSEITMALATIDTLMLQESEANRVSSVLRNDTYYLRIDSYFITKEEFENIQLDADSVKVDTVIQ